MIHKDLSPEAQAALGAVWQADTRLCTCYPGEAPVPCPRKFAVQDCWREHSANLIEQMIGQMPWKEHNWARCALAIAARAVRRGRHLSPREKLINLAASMEEPDVDGESFPEAKTESPSHERMATNRNRRMKMDIYALHEKMTEHLFPAYSNVDERFLALALCGEAGELANMVKKRWRDGADLTEEIRDEIADIRIYLELLAKCFGIEGIKLDERVKAKLIKVAKKHKARLDAA